MDTMENEEYVRRLGFLYEKVMSLRKDEDYVVYQPQMNKLIEVLEFFLNTAKECSGEVEPVMLSPREEHGGVTATFLVFDIYGEGIQQFCNVIRHCSVLTIDSTTDGICISVTVPNVFIHK